MEIQDKKGSKNSVADHLSRLHVSGTGEIRDSFCDEHLLAVSSHTPWFPQIINFLVTRSIPEHWNRHCKDKFFHELKYYYWEEPLLFHVGYDQIIQGCVAEEEQGDILSMCHSSACGGHCAARKIADKILQSGFIGSPSSRMPTVSIRSAYNARQH